MIHWIRSIRDLPPSMCYVDSLTRQGEVNSTLRQTSATCATSSRSLQMEAVPGTVATKIIEDSTLSLNATTDMDTTTVSRSAFFAAKVTMMTILRLREACCCSYENLQSRSPEWLPIWSFR